MTEKDVINIINSTSSHKAMGADKISARMLKIATPVIAPLVTKLLNYSINSAVFPRTRKTAKVTPQFKRGDPSDVNNYRPIPVLPVLSKIVERHVHNNLYAYLSENKLLFSNQSGFRKYHCTETALLKLIDQLLFNLDKNCVSGLILVDYSKAFDMVDHGILLSKLRVYGISETSFQ